MDVDYPVMSNSTADIDGSEVRWFVIEGLPAGSQVNGVRVTSSGGKTSIRIEAPGLSTSDSGLPDMVVKLPNHFSGDIEDIKITLKAQDTDDDSGHTPAILSDDVTLTLHVNPVAGDVRVQGVTTEEDTGVQFLKNVTVTDKDSTSSVDTGQEVITSLSFKLPDDWTLLNQPADLGSYPVAGEGWLLRKQADGTYTIEFNEVPAATSPVLTQSEREAVLKTFEVLPPAHSSKDETITLTITTVDTNTVNGEIVSDTQTKSYPVKITVTPVAEVVGGDSDGDSTDDLTMTEGYTYEQPTSQAGEDDWFELNQEGFDLKAGWGNQDDDEHTFALLTPQYADGSPALGAMFRYTDTKGDIQVVTFNGSAVELPLGSLQTVAFKAPKDESGAFKIQVKAKTYDYDDDTESGTPATAISGEAWLDGIVITPQAEAEDRYTLAVTPARGLEDGGRDLTVPYEDWTGIPFGIRVASTDPSETFDITINDIPDGATLYLNGVKLDVDNGSVTIVEFKNTDKVSIKPVEHYSGTINLKVEASVFDTDVNGDRVPLDLPAEHTWNSQTVPVQVRGVADETTGLEPESDLAEITFEEGVLDAAGNSIALKDLVSAPELVDTDTSEALSIRLTGLDEQFKVKGATFIGGEGSERTWIIAADQFENVEIIVPEHFNGEVKATVAAVTTERDGDSLTGPEVAIKAIVTPTVDDATTVKASSELLEDTWGKVNFHVSHGNDGDDDEKLTKVWIKVADTKRDDFELRLGGEDGATFEGHRSALIDGVQYYALTLEQFNNLYIKAAHNTHHNAENKLEFEFLYEITDPAKADDSDDAVVRKSGGEYSATVKAVTDNLEGLKLADEAPTVLTESTKDVKVGIQLTKADDYQDGSEQFIQVRVSGVPQGVMVKGFDFDGPASRAPAIFLGGSTWLITIPASEAAKFDTQTLKGEVVFDVGPYAEAANGVGITIQAVTRDDGADNLVADRVTWNLTTNYSGDGSGDRPEVTVDLERNEDFSATEDGWFSLADAFSVGDGTELPVNGAQFSVVVTLPEGSTIQKGTELLSSTTILGSDGEPKEVWVITGSGSADDLAAMLDTIQVKPPKDFNTTKDDADGFAPEITVTAYDPANGLQGQGDIEGSIPVTPVTDGASIDVDFYALDDGGNKIDPEEGRDVQISLKITTGVDGVTTLGDKVYIKLGHTALPGTLKDATGKEISTITIGADGGPGLAAGEYYAVDVSNQTIQPGTPLELHLSYTPDAGYKYSAGQLTLQAWVESTESGAANKELVSSDEATVKLDVVHNDYEVAVGTDGVVSGTENQTGKERIELEIGGAGLQDDTHGKESIFAALLKNLPNGFLVFAGADEAGAKLAGNAGTNAEGGNDWNIPLIDGELPGYIAIQPPQNWSGTLEGLELSVLSGESSLDGQNISTADFTLEVEARADGLEFLKPAPAFGEEGDKIALNLNIAMKDGEAVDDTDDSAETVTLTLKGLGEFAAFQTTDQDRVTSVAYDKVSDTYTLSGLSQADVNSLSVIQAAGVVTGKVEVKAWTVEENGPAGDESAILTGEFELNITEQSATGGSDNLLYSGGLLDGLGGNDTIWLRDGDGIDFEKSDTVIKNVEKVDLLGGDHYLFGLNINDVVAMVGANGTLTIDADSDDEITFVRDEEGGWGWYKHEEGDEYTVYKYLSERGEAPDPELEGDEGKPHQIHTATVKISSAAPVDQNTLVDAPEDLTPPTGDEGTDSMDGMQMMSMSLGGESIESEESDDTPADATDDEFTAANVNAKTDGDDDIILSDEVFVEGLDDGTVETLLASLDQAESSSDEEEEGGDDDATVVADGVDGDAVEGSDASDEAEVTVAGDEVEAAGDTGSTATAKSDAKADDKADDEDAKPSKAAAETSSTAATADKADTTVDAKSDDKGKKDDKGASKAPAYSDNPEVAVLDGLSSVNDLISNTMNKPMTD